MRLTSGEFLVHCQITKEFAPIIWPSVIANDQLRGWSDEDERERFLVNDQKSSSLTAVESDQLALEVIVRIYTGSPSALWGFIQRQRAMQLEEAGG